MVGRNQRMPNWRGSTPAPPVRRATRSAPPPADVTRKVFERRLVCSVADWINKPAKPRRIAAAEHHQLAAGHADDRRSGQRRQSLGGDLLDQARFQSDEFGGAG